MSGSSNKCLEGVPGVGFILVKNNVIESSKGNCHSLSLDLFDQWDSMEKNKQWRFTPPTHVLAAFYQAIKEFTKEGGVEGRLKRYSNNCKIICEGMKKLGFKQLLPDNLQAPIIITFMQPQSSNFNFEKSSIFMSGIISRFIVNLTSVPSKGLPSKSTLGCIAGLIFLSVKSFLILSETCFSTTSPET